MRTAVHIQQTFNLKASRILKETKSLVDHGIVDRVVIIGQNFSDAPLQEQIDESRSVIRIQSRWLGNDNSVKRQRIPGVLLWLEKVFLIIRLIQKIKPDYINFHRIDQLSLLLFIRLVSRKSKLIYDTHELETEKNGLKGRKKKLFKAYEKLFIGSFKHVFVVSPSIEEWYRSEYQITNVTTVMNCPPRSFSRVEKKDLFREKFNIGPEKRVFLYQGALSVGRGLDVILETFSKINDDFVIVFLGYGTYESVIKEYMLKNENIFFHEAVDASVLSNYTSSADIGISLIENACLSYYYCLPNKLFEYLNAGIPSIVSNMKELKRYAEINKVGIVSEELSVDGLSQAIRTICSFPEDYFKENIQAAQKAYNWEIQEQHMIAVYNAMQN